MSSSALVIGPSPNERSLSWKPIRIAASPLATTSPHLAGVSNSDLAQHYLTHTTATFVVTSTRDEQSDFWRTVVPALAYTSSPVQHGMLALAALSSHFHTTSSANSSSIFLAAAITHGNLVLKESGQQLQALRSSVTDSVLTCARIICVLGFAFFRLRRQDGATIVDPESWIWLQMLRGVEIVQASISAVYRNFDALIARDMRPELPPVRTTCGGRSEKTTICSHPLFCRIQKTHQHVFITLRTGLQGGVSSFSKEQAADLFCAVDILQEVTEHICSGDADSIFRAVCTWPCQIPQDFVHMLIEGNAFALAVYAHWLVLVILVEESWWMNDMGRVGIRQIIEMSVNSSDEPNEVSTLLCWPRSMLDSNSSELSHLSDS